MDSEFAGYTICALLVIVPLFFIGAVVWMSKSGFFQGMQDLKDQEKKREREELIREIKEAQD